MSVLASHEPGACVIFERSPVDYLAYAAASRAADFLEEYVPVVRESVRNLDLIALVPVSYKGPITPRADEDDRFRRRVDEWLRRTLIDDDYGLFGDSGSPLVVELSPLPERRLAELIRLTLPR